MANARSLHSGMDNASGASSLFTIRTVVAFDGAITVRLITANWGIASMGLQTLPLICSTTEGRFVSLQLTVIDFSTALPKPELLNWMGMLPILPGSTCLDQSPAVVQPQET